jgi:hypothetical protein
LSVKTLCSVVSVGLIGGLFVGVAFQQGWFNGVEPEARRNVVEAAEGDSGSLESVPEGYQWAGGVLRPSSDLKAQDPLELPIIGEKAIGKRMGRSPAVNPETNAATRSVAAALADPAAFPERLGPAFPAPDFDLDTFTADPQKYLNTIEPGRIWQSLPKGEGVPQISRQSPLYQSLIQGEAVTLRVKVIPDAVVTFHSFDLGHFDNQMTTTSVQAGEDGIATVNFNASGGTFGELNILAASPQTSGQVNFVVKVGLPAVAVAR